MPPLGAVAAVTAVGLASGLLLAAGIHLAGPKGAIAPAIAVLCLVLLRFPGFTFGLLMVATVLAEEGAGVLPSGAAFYDQVASSLTAPDLLILICLGGVLLRFALDGRRPLLPAPMTIALIVLALAVLAGTITAVSAPDPPAAGDLFHRVMHVGYLILLPVLAVNVLRDNRALKLFAAFAAALATLKGLTGIYGSLAGVGEVVEEETITYISPLPNLLMLVLVLGSAAALVRRVKIPAWALAGAPIALLALVLSLRRSFWIATAFTLVVVVIVASRRRGRAVMAIAALALALALAAIVTVGSSDPGSSPLLTRVQTLSPSGLATNRGDRYREDERHNVIENLEEHPLTGVGLGVPWKVHQPLAEAHDRRYTHVALLWFWLAFGPLGAAAYLALMGTALGTAMLIWRRHPDPVVQVCAIAAFGAVVGLGIVELTATFTGFEPRISLMVGAGLGWLAAAWRQLPRPAGLPAAA
jgi:hypothetical protein